MSANPSKRRGGGRGGWNKKKKRPLASLGEWDLRVIKGEGHARKKDGRLICHGEGGLNQKVF